MRRRKWRIAKWESVVPSNSVARPNWFLLESTELRYRSLRFYDRISIPFVVAAAVVVVAVVEIVADADGTAS